jgi:hypothetical protein
MGCLLELGRERNVHQIAGDHHVVGILGTQGLAQGVEDRSLVHVPAPMLPGQETKQALVQERPG